MPETETRPARKRAPRATSTKPQATVAPAAPVAAKAPTASVSDEGKMRISFPLDALDPTKSYAVFSPPADSGCVGKLYVPLGTEEVRVLLIGPAS